jgi:hypothetical protein
VVIAAVEGSCHAGGLGFCCAADIAIAAASGRFCAPEVRRGLVPARILPWLARRTGILSANGESSTTPLAPGRVDLRARPGPTQLAALCPGSAWRMRAIRPSGPRITESRPSALSPQPQSAASDVHGLRG